MGGYGSGRARAHKKPRVEDTFPLDIAWMKRSGNLRWGNILSVRWSCRGRETASVAVTVLSECLSLTYTYQGSPVVQRIDTERVPCNYGGTRQYFLCPRCGRRAMKVYCLQRDFLCRHCLGLTYHSRRDIFGGAASRIHELEERLKKKGIHSRTRYRIEEQIFILERRAYIKLGIIDKRILQIEKEFLRHQGGCF